MVTTRNAKQYPGIQFDAMIDKFAKTLTYTSVTKTINNVTGDETLTTGTPETIIGVFYRKEDVWNIKRFGELNGADAVLLIKRNVTLTRNSIISFDSIDYRIKNDPIKRYIGADVQHITVHLFRIE